jgi:hypothetical protein
MQTATAIQAAQSIPHRIAKLSAQCCVYACYGVSLPQDDVLLLHVLQLLLT